MDPRALPNLVLRLTDVLSQIDSLPLRAPHSAADVSRSGGLRGGRNSATSADPPCSSRPAARPGRDDAEDTICPLPNCGLDHIAAPYSWLIPANQQSISATGIIRLTSLFSQLDRHEEDQTGRYGKTKKKASK